MSDRTTGHENGREMEPPRPGDRLTGRELLRQIDARQEENRSRHHWSLGIPAYSPGSWWLDPRYG